MPTTEQKLAFALAALERARRDFEELANDHRMKLDPAFALDRAQQALDVLHGKTPFPSTQDGRK